MEEKDWDQLAERYHDEVVSPFFGDVDNPLLDEIKKIEDKKEKTVAEFGCGLFYLGEILSKQFKEVHASDFSQGMVDKAIERNKELINNKDNKSGNITIKQEDLTKIKYKNKFDVIISVNSIIMPSFRKIRKAFDNIYRALKQDGTCFFIIPSMESVLHHGNLILHQQLDKHGEKEHIAKRIAKIKAEKKKYDFFFGYYKDGKDKQKFYYKHEIRYLLKKAGFDTSKEGGKITINKVEYPWGKDISDYEDFPDENKLWDWFIRVEK
ncbi:MAG: class I SAM-dependent methyltransferase [Candidatus Woesearchaeota archaeon]